jgi:hypothetical protein
MLIRLVLRFASGPKKFYVQAAREQLGIPKRIECGK